MSRKGASPIAAKSLPELSPEEYGRIIQGLELHEIALDKMHARVEKELLSSMENVPLTVEGDSDYTVDRGFTVRSRLHVLCKHDERICLSIEAFYSLCFSSRVEISTEFFEIFKFVNLPLYVWPFFRELVNSVTQRMNIPPLTLPLYKPGGETESPAG